MERRIEMILYDRDNNEEGRAIIHESTEMMFFNEIAKMILGEEEKEN